jgi:cyanophycinase-like exopeptidase
VTFNPDAAVSDKAYQKSKPKRRVSLGLTINAETGEVIVTDGTIAVGGEGDSAVLNQLKIRHSKRTHTVQNTVETVKRLKSSEKKKARYHHFCSSR